MKLQNRDGVEVGRGFEDLKAWQLARRLMIECHKLANTLPSVERSVAEDTAPYNLSLCDPEEDSNESPSE